MDEKFTTIARSNVLLVQSLALKNNTELTEYQVINGILENITFENAETFADILTREIPANAGTQKRERKKNKIKDGRGRKHEQPRFVLDSKIVMLTQRQEYKLKGMYGGLYPTAVKMLEDHISKTGVQINHYAALVRKDRPIYKQIFKSKETQQCVTLS